jgi:exopolysaccharide biosynthesis polyprenyl glycosylphosphotransferase
MNTQVKNRIIPSLELTNEVAAFRNNTTNKYPGFSASFSERKTLLVLGDALLVVLAFFGAHLLWQQTANSGFDFAAQIKDHWYWFPILFSGWLLLAWLNDLYDIPSSFDKITSAERALIVGMINLVIYLLVFFLIPSQLPRAFFLYFLVIVWPAITLWRWTYAILFSRFPHRVLILGQGERAHTIAKTLKEALKLNFQVLGYVDYEVPAPQTANDGLPVFGQVIDLPVLVQQLQIHEVVVALEQGLRTNLFELLVECQSNGVQVSLMSDLYEKLQRKTPVEHINPAWILQAIQDRPVSSRLRLGLKRLMDVLLATLGLLYFLPCFLLIAIAIRLDSSGPIFYRQMRCGRAGRPFSIIKFRTMFVNAEKDGNPRWASKDDPRITRVGRFLRKTRIDETPQLLNRIFGNMSFVGPRPERPEFVEILQQQIPFYRTRLMLKPGLTGWAQIHHEYGNSVEDALIKLQYDLYYLRHWSIWLDLYIIFRTIGVVLKFEGM